VIRRTPDTRRLADGSIAGVVMIVDRFGNLVTNIGARLTGAVEVAGQRIAVGRTYADVGEGELIALAGTTEYSVL
jgi:S-adenosylmethionine hydrolase